MVRVFPSYDTARRLREGRIGSGQTGRDNMGSQVEVDGRGQLQQCDIVGDSVCVIAAKNKVKFTRGRKAGDLTAHGAIAAAKIIVFHTQS